VVDFVNAGGTLIVLGDHTDVFGLMEGFNSLLDVFGIEFQFDSAYPARQGWRGCAVPSSDAVAWRWERDHCGVAIGALLKLGGNARPLVTGRYAHSDHGFRANAVGSFLGNYRYDAGEQVGDLALAAVCSSGSGRVIVWGDT
jgi:hypothetical protein